MSNCETWPDLTGAEVSFGILEDPNGGLVLSGRDQQTPFKVKVYINEGDCMLETCLGGGGVDKMLLDNAALLQSELGSIPDPDLLPKAKFYRQVIPAFHEFCAGNNPASALRDHINIAQQLIIHAPVLTTR